MDKIFKKISYKLILFLGVIFFSGCQPFMRLVTGIDSKLEYTIDNEKRMKYYNPYLKANNISIFTFKDPEDFCKNFNFFGRLVSVVYFEDIENNKYYKVNCFDDIKNTFEEINNIENFSYFKPVSVNEFLSIKNYIIQKSERVFNKENNNQYKKWNVYLISGIFMGEKLKRRTVTLTKINELNYLYILDLTVNNTNKTITEKDFQTEECSVFTKEKVDYLR